MDPRPRKLLASASYGSQGVKACTCSTSSLIDRLRNLPDPVAHHILSFLAIRDLTRFGCVSKRCRQLYLSTPSLDFDVFAETFQVRNTRLRILSSLERFLILRGVNKIQRFCIDFWSEFEGMDGKDAIYRIMTWIHNAIRCNVEVLHLSIHIYPETDLLFPSCFFRCGCLRSLLFNGKGCKILNEPSLDSFSNLEYLKLKEVNISNEGIFKWISCCCKCIKELHLENVCGIENVNVESSSLESFSFVHKHSNLYKTTHLNISSEKLEDIHIDWGSGSHYERGSLLNIFAPNLKCIKWSGNLSIPQNLGELMCVKKAELLLIPEENPYFNIVIEVLCRMPKVEVLILNEETTMAVFNGDHSIPTPLDNVYHLCIHIWSFLDIIVPNMVSLFEGMRNLSTLDIKSDPFFVDPKDDCSGFNMGYWKLQNLPFIHQLEEITIELSDGSNGIEFAKYILSHAHYLKKMVIVHSPQQSNSLRRLNKSKTTSYATVVFQEDKERGTKRQRGRRVR